MKEKPKHDPYESFRYPAFRYLVTARFLSSFALLMIETVLGWHMYEKTGSKFVLGLLGLFEILPTLALSLYAGQLADRHDRRKMTMMTQTGYLLSCLLIAFFTVIDAPTSFIFFAVLCMGIARAFNFPVSSTLLVRTVPSHLYPNAAAWSSTIWQIAAVTGPAVGGFSIALFNSAASSYCAASILIFIAILCLTQITDLNADKKKSVTEAKDILEGFRFLRSKPLLLSVISLDLFAVLLGGAVALLPVFAKDILVVGPSGLGWLRAAPSVGAVITTLYIAHRPPFRRTGMTLLLAVGGFGLSTIVFGFSTIPVLSFAMLFLTGVFDSISVIIRSTLLLVSVPDSMRGRVSAINSIFIGSSNELGAFESGTVASIFGPVASVVSGGIGTLLVVLFTAINFPQLRKLGPLNESRINEKKSEDELLVPAA